ncbi:MAG: DUF2723 domain-containing protein, partial [Verrucomicrobia bacterium]|nr:DUF2723 domain-containing protein [Verrucomicrobiota bacterium]
MASQRRAPVVNEKPRKAEALPPVPIAPVIAPEAPPERLFRRCDWIAAGVAFLIAMAGYVYMMAPNVTLEDSGELVTAAHNLGVPHPPGYPIWTIMGFLFDHLNPLSPQPVPEGVDVSPRRYNIAWRLCFMSGTFGALAVGLLALLISRSGSMLLRSVKSLSDAINEEQERGIATVCGVAGALIFAFCPTPLSQALISEVYSLNGLFMAATMTTLFTWMWNTQRNRYLYLTCLLWGLGLTNHQTLLFMAPAYLILVGLVSVAALMDLLVAGAMVGMVGFWFIGWCTSTTTIGEVAMGCLIGLPVIGLFVADRLANLRRGSEAWMILKGLTLVAVAVALAVAAYWYFTKADQFWVGVACAA